ncbi:glycosyltransferase family 2 protein [Aliarcobacter cryaerophilus]|uniref:glycosyltransferase family 2 protein n=1 Tax=Aliarcobacter cryaerophilus TaxID=28198 RepID=UPI0021B5C28E|nr:glycosyltransferase family 2 protein [Aliarcobacter cryaerophilus]MCT7466319.1 glycosyltransferase family 2 protein [Aliarcobacter cryaerophilus]
MIEENNLPLVSVVVPCYNHEKYVKETIESIINQTYKNIELIVIDDGSKDNSVEAIKEMIPACEKRFPRFEFRHRENKGLSATLNEMVDWAKGKYFTGCASDDIFLPSKISHLVEKLENSDDSYSVAFGDAIFIDDNSNEVYIDRKTGEYTTEENGSKFFLDYYTFERDFDYKDEKSFGSYKTLLAGNYLPAMSYVIKLDKIREVGAWTSGNTIEDWEMWLKLSKDYKFAYIDEPVAFYRWHDSNTCKTMKFELVIDSLKLLEVEENYAFSKGYKSTFYTTLVNLVIQLRIHNKSMLIKKLIQYSINPVFIYFFVLKLISKIKKY